MSRATRTFGLVSVLAFSLQFASAQGAPGSAKLPAFDAATIKPPDPAGKSRHAGFSGEPGGRVFFGGRLKWLVQYAFNLQDHQISGGPEWVGTQWFEINAVPPEGSLSRNIKVRNAQPTPEQRQMLQSLLRDRFGFEFHMESKVGEVYILTRGRKPLALRPPKDPEADPRAIVMRRPGDIIDGEAVGTNTTTAYMAQMLSRYLELPVVDRTGITGSYDYYLPPNDPENQDMVAAALGVVHRLGFKIKRGRGPIQTLVIDRVTQPSEN